MNESPATDACPAIAAIDDPLLRRRLTVYRTHVVRELRPFVDDVLEAQHDLLAELVADWQANVAAQVEYVERFAADGVPVDRLRSEWFRAHRDLMRWLRRRTERVEAQLRSSARPATLHEPVQGLVERTEALHTLSAPVDASIFAPDEGDGWWLRTRKKLARGRVPDDGAPQRGVPLSQLARAFALPKLLEDLEGHANRLAAFRIFIWRRLHGVVGEFAQLFERVDGELADGHVVDWSAVREAFDAVIEPLGTEVERFERSLAQRRAADLEATFDTLVHAALRSDTFLLPPRRYDADAGEARAERTRGRIKDDSDRWARLSAGAIGAVASALDAHAFVAAVRYAHFRDAHELSQLFDEVLAVPAQRLAERATAARDRLASILDGDGDPADCEVLVDGQKVSLHQFIENECLEALADTDVRERFVAVIDETRRSIRRASQRVTPTFDVVSRQAWHVDEGARPRTVQTWEIPLRSWAGSMVIERLASQLDAWAASLTSTLEGAEDSVRELVRIVDYNLDAASEELHRQAEDDESTVDELARQYATNGLDRLVERTERLSKVIASAREGVVDAFDAPVPEALTAFTERVFKLPDQAHEDSAAPPAERLVARAPRQGLADHARQRVTAIAHRIVPPEDVPDGVTTREELANHLRRMQWSVIERTGVPNTYVRLFRDGADASGETRVGVGTTLEQVRQTVEAWEQGDPESVAVVGVRGLGRRSALERIATEVVDGYPTRRIAIAGRVSTENELVAALADGLHLGDVHHADDLIHALNSRSDRAVIIVDGGERTFLRHPSGLAAVRALLAVINATSDRLLWVVGFEASAFEFLTSVLSLSDAFTSVAHLEPLGRAELEELVMVRHRISGMGLQFEPRRQPDGSWLEGGDAQRDTFDDLHRRSFGHPTLAMFLWLSAASVEKGQVVIGDFAPVPADLVGVLSGIKCAALGALLLHGGLDAHSFSRVMRMPLDEARQLLGQMRHLHLVETTATGDIAVNGIAVWSIYEGLRRRNVL